MLRARNSIIQIHDRDYERVLQNQWVPKFVRAPAAIFYAILERLILPRFAGVVIVSDEMRDRYDSYVGKERVALVRNFTQINAAEVAAARNTNHPFGNEQYILHTKKCNA